MGTIDRIDIKYFRFMEGGCSNVIIAQVRRCASSKASRLTWASSLLVWTGARSTSWQYIRQSSLEFHRWWTIMKTAAWREAWGKRHDASSLGVEVG